MNFEYVERIENTELDFVDNIVVSLLRKELPVSKEKMCREIEADKRYGRYSCITSKFRIPGF